MEIEQVINKWFKETESKLAQTDNEDVVFHVCRSMFAVFKKYCDAILLLANDFRMPTKALLRIINDFCITFVWWLQGKTLAEIENRICRSECTCYEREKKIYEKAVTSNSQELKKFAEEQLKCLGKQRHKLKVKQPAPDMLEMLKKISDLFDKPDAVYAKMVMQFHKAVHLDYSVLGWSATGGKYGLFQFEEDLAGDGENLKLCCLAVFYWFIETIYNHYNWSFKEIKDEMQGIIAPACKQ
jgi:hypothetical protein